MDELSPEPVPLRLTLLGWLMPKSPRRRRLEKAVCDYMREHFDLTVARVFARDAADYWQKHGSFQLSEHPRAAIGHEYVRFAISVMSLAVYRGGFSRKSLEPMGLSSLKLLVTVLGAEPSDASAAIVECYTDARALQPFAPERDERDWEAMPPDSRNRLLLYKAAGAVADRIVDAVSRGARSVEPTKEEVARIDYLVQSRVE